MNKVQQWVQLLISGDGIVDPFTIEFSLLFDMPVHLQNQGFTGITYTDKMAQAWSSLKIESSQDSFVTIRRAEASSTDANLVVNVPVMHRNSEVRNTHEFL